MVYGVDYNAVDIGALALILLAAILGWRRGLAGSLFRLMCVLLVLLAGLRLYGPGGDALARHTSWLDGNPDLAGALAFLLVAAFLGLALLIAQALLRALMTVAFNEKINRPGGMVAGVVHGLALAVLIVYAVGLWPAPAVHRRWVQNSFAGRTVFRLCPRMVSALDQVTFRSPPVRAADAERGD